MEILTMLVSKKFKEGENDVEKVNNSCGVKNDAMNDWMESRMAQDIANEKNDVMNRNQRLVVSERIIGVRKNRVEFSIRVKNATRFYELKSSIWEKCLEEELHMSMKNTKMKCVKRVGMLVRVCASFDSK